MGGLVLTEQRDGVAVLTLNRPEKRNALSVALRNDVARALAEAELRAFHRGLFGRDPD